MITANSISQNSAYSLISTLVQKGLTLAYFILVARSFGPQDQGLYSAALSFTTLFGVLIDLGLSAALTRETARHPDRASDYFSQMIFARVGMSALVYGLMAVSAGLIGYSSLLVSMILVAGVAACIDVLSTSLWAMMRGFQNLKYEAIGGVLAIVTMMIFGGAAIVLGMPITALVYAVLFGSSANMLYALALLFWKARLGFAWRIDPRILKSLVLLALPFACAAIFSRIYTFADTALLARLVGEHFAGVYAAGNKLILALNMIPAAISASIFPAMSSAVLSEPERMPHIYYRAHVFLFMVSLPMALGLYFLAPQIVQLFYGDQYVSTIPVMQWLALGLAFGFCMYPVGALLAAANRQRTNTIIFGIAAGANILLNIILIPRLYASGAAIASAATSAIIFCASLAASYTLWRGQRQAMASATGKIIAASVLMTAVIIVVRDFMPVLISIGIGVGVYAVAILLLGVIPSPEMERIRSMIGLRRTQP